MAARIWLIRHGETDWSRTGRHTGRTDLPLTANGEQVAATLAPTVRQLSPELVLCSPLERARRTAELAGLEPDELTSDLLEWDYGAWEGRTTAEIREEQRDPHWLIWDHPVPGGSAPGEQLDEVAVRVERVIAHCAPVLDSGRDCVLIAHGHVLRILTARWLGLPPIDGRLFALDAGRLSALGFEHQTRTITLWNSASATL